MSDIFSQPQPENVIGAGQKNSPAPNPENPLEDKDRYAGVYRLYTLTELDVPEPEIRSATARKQKARKKAEEIERQAYEQGFSQGEKDGQELGTKKLDKIMDRVENICQDLDSFHVQFVHQHEQEILNLISAVAGKVIRAKVELDNEIVKKAVMDAIDAAAQSQEITVRVDPMDFEYIEEIRPQFFEKASQLRSINIVADPEVSRGGCVVSADFGEIDAKISTRLDKVAQAMMNVYHTGRT